MILRFPVDVSQLSPEEKIRITIEMTDAMVRICADGIRENHPGITDEELLGELRRRIYGE